MKIYSLNNFASNKFYRIELSMEGGIFKPIYGFMLNFATHGPCTVLTENGIMCFHLRDAYRMIPTPFYDYKKHWTKEACGIVEQKLKR